MLLSEVNEGLPDLPTIEWIGNIRDPFMYSFSFFEKEKELTIYTRTKLGNINLGKEEGGQAGQPNTRR